MPLNKLGMRANAKDSPLSELLSPSQAAEKVDTSVRTIQRLMADGKLPYESIGNDKYIRLADLERVWEQRREESHGTGHGKERLRLDYWTAFSHLLEWQGHPVRWPKPQPQSWFAKTISGDCRVAAHIRLQESLIGVDLTLGRKSKHLFVELEKEQGRINDEIRGGVQWANIGGEMQWLPRPNNAESWILLRRKSDVNDRALWSAQHYWLSKYLWAFYTVFEPRLKRIS